jgi:hypothetical protein
MLRRTRTAQRLQIRPVIYKEKEQRWVKDKGRSDEDREGSIISEQGRTDLGTARFNV